MSNKRVTELVELTAGEVASDDLFFIIDSSARESKKLQSSQLLSYIVASGSFTATSATIAATASYIDPNNVGLIPSASHGITSRTASFAITTPLATTASFAITASFVLGSGTPTLASSSSFLVFTPGTPNGTASFALTSSTARNAFSSSFLIYTGTGNGTASYAVNAATANSATTASYFNPQPGSASFATASWAYEALHAADSDTSDLATLATSADFLNYDGITPNGTASYAVMALSASFSQINITSSYTVFSVISDTASLANTASVVLNTLIDGTNTVVGSGAGADRTNLSFATIMGIDAVANATFDATSLVAIGTNAGTNTTNAAQGTYIGTSAGASTLEGDSATLIGFGAGNFATTSSRSTMIGFQSGRLAADAPDVVFAGYQAGYNAASSSKSVFIGTFSDVVADSTLATGSIAIGYGARVSGSNICSLGGTGSNAVKVVIGGITSQNTLDVVGNISCSVITASLLGSSSFAVTASALATPQSSSNTPSDAVTPVGWMAVNVNGTTAYIPLYI